MRGPTDKTPDRSHEAAALSLREVEIIDPTAVEREDTGIGIKEPHDL